MNPGTPSRPASPAPSGPLRHFASDNYGGICPEAFAAMAEANVGHSPGYGDDRWTQEAADLLRETFETDCEVFFAFNGTAANSLALAALCQSYHSILCHETAHVETDECGAPEFFSNGTKVLTLPGPNGKLRPDGIDHMVRRRTDIHYPKPRVVSVTLPTELGTLYTVDELRAIGERARANGLRFHMDGSRFGNAVAALGVAPKDLTWKVGVDVLCFGGTKAGMAVGEAIVFFDRALAADFDYRCKQAGQLASKMRFLAAPWVGMLRGGAWLRHARHTNAMAALLERALRAVPGVEILQPVQANSVFATLPGDAAAQLRARGWRFYDFIGSGGVRLMCAWDVTPADVEAFTADLRLAVAGRR
ncbi:low specificity L-threonine aldolase [Anaeromyxobacter sp. PSR-1]|uniref:threonine aldolase family protein n=1 Tax=unclassified Anaeromyxobacter TaxID=2620896 RepID=UPI0005E7EC14|nr:low specificity L-threonine aldolase [Anaeromyxobacter sp. PSR-1]GAO03373.1 low specificity L-threonine aldolase [Anaeromyxobacter sp. PSR-1]